MANSQPDRFLTLREVVDLLDVDENAVSALHMDPDQRLPLITLWPVGVMKGAMFVNLPEDDQALCDQAMSYGAALILSSEQVKGALQP